MPQGSARVIAALVAGLIAAAAPLTSFAGENEKKKPGNRKDTTRSSLGFESEREAKIRRARDEIQKDPKQKKFILFRYGLNEADL